MAEPVALSIALEPQKHTRKGYTTDEKLRVIARLLTPHGILNKAQLQPRIEARHRISLALVFFL